MPPETPEIAATPAIPENLANRRTRRGAPAGPSATLRISAVVLAAIGLGQFQGCERIEPHRHARIEMVGDQALAPIELAPRPGEPAVYESSEVRGQFHEAMLGWNVDVPPDTGVWFEIRVAQPGLDWSPWMFIGEWGDVPGPSEPITRCETGQVEVDVFVSELLHDRVQWRATAATATEASTPVRITRLDLITTRLGRDPDLTPPRRTPLSLDVPFRSQKTPDESLAGRLCSPTSVAMMLAARGVDATVAEVAATAYDPRHDIYGNWPRNVQAAYELGRRARLTRISSWDEAELLLSMRQPLVISFSAKPGELPEAPYESTGGHLIVLTGFDAAGNLIVNDPALATAQEGRLVYPRAAMTALWLGRARGTAYIITDEPRTTAAGVAPQLEPIKETTPEPAPSQGE